MLCPLPRRIERVRVSIASPLVQPSPNGRRVGIRIVTFEACSGFTRVTARRIAQPPKVTFVTRLRSHQLPSETARQLPDLSTIIRVEPSSTDDSRLQGALPIPDLMLEVQLVDRATANCERGTGPGAFRDQRPGSGIACSQDRGSPSCSTASRITAKSIASCSELRRQPARSGGSGQRLLWAALRRAGLF